MTTREWKRIRVDWDELADAFEDGSDDHRYYLDRETGAVHFFSAYLDNDEEKEDERVLTSEERYVQVPQSDDALGSEQLARFVATLGEERDRRILNQALRAPGGTKRFQEAIEVLPSAKREWRHFSDQNVRARIEAWLSEVSVEPL